MTRRRWGSLPLWVRETAVHEAGHAVVGELIGWPVRCLRVDAADGGLCVYRGGCPAPWIDVIASAAGHAAEVWYRGGKEPSVYGAYHDRRDGVKALERAGVDRADGPFAVCQVEDMLWPVFSDDAVSGAVRRVARALGRRGHLTRAEFLAAADVGRIDRRAVRRFCWRLAVRVHRPLVSFPEGDE